MSYRTVTEDELREEADTLTDDERRALGESAPAHFVTSTCRECLATVRHLTTEPAVHVVCRALREQLAERFGA